MNKKQLSEHSGLSLRMIQFYTEEGIIPCCNLSTGRGKPRIYSEEFGFITSVKAVKNLYDIGMSVSKIKILKENKCLILAGSFARNILGLIRDD